MTKISPETADKLAAAAANLLSEDKALTVRSLKAEAGVATDTAAKWLKKNRPPAVTLETPVEELTAPLTVLWAAAVKLAREETTEETSAHTQAVEQSEAQALTDLDEATQQVAHLTATVQELKQQLAAAQRDAREQTEAAHKAQAQATIAAQRNADLIADRDRLHLQLDALINNVSAPHAKPKTAPRKAATNKVSPENAEKLAAAHKALTARGEKPSRDKLREEAEVSTRDATQWWRDYRKANPNK